MSTNQTDSVDPKVDSVVQDADPAVANADSAGPETDTAVSEADTAVPKTDSVVPAVVIDLIEESETIRGWMGKLADHADEAYPEVLERVKKDYRTRVEGVANRLGEHRPDLAASLEDRQGTVVSLNSDRDSHVADLEEVRLRHVVGEFSEAEWDTHRTKIEGWLDDVDSKLEVEEGAVSELTEALERIDASRPPRTTVAFSSEGYVEVEGGSDRGNAARNGSWSAHLAAAKAEGRPVGADRHSTPEEADEDESDELDFIDAVSTDDRLESGALPSS
jgi:hypothetical protein